MSKYNESYATRMVGRVSRNPIIFVCDMLSQRIAYKAGETVFQHICMWIWVIQFFLQSWLSDCGIDAHWMIYIIFIPWCCPEWIYRYFRHRYLKKHNLPGPYGWGTVDSDQSFMYQS